MLNTHKRYGNTSKKMITLTHQGREQLQQFADTHNMSFSATIESLALIGMEVDLTTFLVPLLHEAVQAGFKRHFNRLAKLSVTAAAESAMAHDLAAMLLLQSLRQEAVQHPEDFETRLEVSHDPQDSLDFRIRDMYNRMRRLARKRQKRLLRQPLVKLMANYAPKADEEEGDA
jgi:hypothetical protein